MSARCPREAEARFESDIFSFRSVVQSAEHPSDTRKVNGANPFTSTMGHRQQIRLSSTSGVKNAWLITMLTSVLQTNVTLTANFHISMVENQSVTLNERFDSAG